MEPKHLITLAETLSGHIGRSEQTISNWAAGHALLFKRLRADKGCTWRVMKKTAQWFSDNWPADLEWPKGIERPDAKRSSAKRRAA